MRKFTTQILSLLTALSFAGALSAQTVGDIGAASDGDSAGMSGLGLKVGITLGKNSNVANRSYQAIYAGLAEGGGAADFIARKNDSGNCSIIGGTTLTGLKAADATSSSTCTGVGTGSATTSASIIDLGLNVEYDWGQFVNMPFFVRTGYMLSIVGKNEYEISVKENWAGNTTVWTASGIGDLLGNSFDQKLTFSTETSYSEIPIVLGVNLIETEKSRMYFNAGIVIINGEHTMTMGATDTYTGTDAVLNALLAGASQPQMPSDGYTSVTNTTEFSGVGLRYMLGGEVEIANNISLFGELMITEASDIDATITGTETTAGKTYASDHRLFSALPQSTQDQLAISGGKPGPITSKTAANYSATGSAKTVATTVANMSSTRVQLGVNYSL